MRYPDSTTYPWYSDCDGCGCCPIAPVTRGQMAVFSTTTFDLGLYVP